MGKQGFQARASGKRAAQQGLRSRPGRCTHAKAVPQLPAGHLCRISPASALLSVNLGTFSWRWVEHLRQLVRQRLLAGHGGVLVG